MGVCLSWTLSKEIDPASWAQIATDFRQVATDFPQWVDERRRTYEDCQPALARWAGTLMGSKLVGPYPRAGYAPFAWGNGGTGFSPETVEVNPGPAIDKFADTAPWSFSRRAVAGFARTNAAIHGDLLLALLAIVHDRSPGTLVVTQNDYLSSGDESGMAYIEKFVSRSLGRPILFPTTCLDATDRGPEDPALSRTMFDPPFVAPSEVSVPPLPPLPPLSSSTSAAAPRLSRRKPR